MLWNYGFIVFWDGTQMDARASKDILEIRGQGQWIRMASIESSFRFRYTRNEESFQNVRCN